jgi:hypothetical protein
MNKKLEKKILTVINNYLKLAKRSKKKKKHIKPKTRHFKKILVSSSSYSNINGKKKYNMNSYYNDGNKIYVKNIHDGVVKTYIIPRKLQRKSKKK